MSTHTHDSVFDVVESCRSMSDKPPLGSLLDLRRAIAQYRFEPSPPAKKLQSSLLIAQLVPSQLINSRLKTSKPAGIQSYASLLVYRLAHHRTWRGSCFDTSMTPAILSTCL